MSSYTKVCESRIKIGQPARLSMQKGFSLSNESQVSIEDENQWPVNK